MNTPETRALENYGRSPWRLLAIGVIDSLGPAWKEHPDFAVGQLCNAMAQAYRRGCEDQRKHDRECRGCPDCGAMDWELK